MTIHKDGSNDIDPVQVKLDKKSFFQVPKFFLIKQLLYKRYGAQKIWKENSIKC